MKVTKTIFWNLLIVIILLNSNTFSQVTKQLIIRGDDMGFSHAANLACIQAYKEGILTSAEVMAPTPWFLDAAEMLQENPELDVGVHLTLTCEWVNYKWGPITNSPSLVDENGYFPPDNNRFMGLNPSLAEIEAELRKQIELAIQHIPHVSHLSFHMGTAIYNTELTNLTYRLSVEYNLPMTPAGNTNWLEGMWGQPANSKENYFTNIVQNLQPGLYVFICHPAFDNDETKAIQGTGNDANTRMAVHRNVVTGILCSQEIKQLINDRNIQLLSYADTYGSTDVASDLNKSLIKKFQLFQNYPNPFNPETVISYQLSVDSDIELSVYNMTGQGVATLISGRQAAGEHRVQWNAEGLPSGIYFARLQAGNFVKTQKLILNK